MDLVLDMVIANARNLVAGSTALLGIGVLAVLFSRAPIHRQRTAELVVIAAFVWFVLAFVPLPRWPAPGDVPLVDAPARSLVLPAAASAPAITPERTNWAWSMPEISSPVPSAPSVPLPVRAAAPVDWLELAAGTYLLGALLSAAYLLLGVILLQRLLGRTQPAPAWLQQQLQGLAAQMAMPAPALRLSSSSRRPFCCGWRRPVVVLPAGLCQRRHREMLRAVLLHELGHLHQRDGRGRVLFALTLPLFYAHPFYWWLRSRAYFAAELVADDWAARASDRRGYADSLIRLSEGTTAAGPICVGAMPVLHSPSEFYRRMKMLIQSDHHVATECSPRRRGLQLVCAGLLVAASAGLWGVELPAQSPRGENAVQQERDDLRREVAELRSELRILKKELKRFAAAGAPSSRGPGWVMPDGPPLVVPVPSAPLPPATAPIGEGPTGRRAATPAAPAAPSHPLALPPEPPALSVPDVVASELAGAMAPRAPNAAPRSPLLALATQRIELSGQIEVAETRLEMTARQVADGAVDRSEVTVAQIELKTLQRKNELLEHMINAELAACDFEIKRLKKQMARTAALAEKGYVRADEVAEVEADYLRLQAVRLLLRKVR